MYTDDRHTQKSNLTFMRHVMRFSILTPEKEKILLDQWFDHQDQEALHSLICAHERLVVSLSVRFSSYNLPVADMVQEGNLGLMQAALRFDRSKKVRFVTYASWWIRAHIQDYILRNWSIVRTGTTSPQKTLFFKLKSLKRRLGILSNQFLSQDLREQMALDLHIPLADLEVIDNRLTLYDQSLNTPHFFNEKGEMLDQLTDVQPSPEGLCMKKDSRTQQRHLLQAALKRLTPREQEVIRQRQLGEKSLSLRKTGVILGISKERVRQLETRALKKLKEILSGQIPHLCDLYE
jgi:RNA polymerase sigma-32 factor